MADVKPTRSRPLTHKIVIIGNSGVGKTSLLTRFVDGSFDPELICTIGVDFKVKNIEVNGQTMKLALWDTAGQERFRGVVSTYYRSVKGVMILYDVNDANSFSNVERWIQEMNQYGDSDDIPKILVAAKCEDETSRVVPAADGQRLAESFGFHFIETSARNNLNVHLAFEMLAREILKRYSDTNTDNGNAIRVRQVPGGKLKKKKSCC